MQNQTYQRIEIFLSGRNLKDLDFFSKSDPYIKVSYRRDFNCKNYLSVGKTETIQNNLNPTFSRTFLIDYIFQSKQDIKFEVFDDDGGNDDFIGDVVTTVGALMGAKNQTSILELKKEGKSQGKLVVRCQPRTDSGVFYEIKFKAKKLMNTDSWFDFWDKSDPYLKFLKIRNDNSLVEAGRTETIMDNLNPNWKLCQIQQDRLHNQNSSRFKVQCLDWQESGKDQFIGELFLDVEALKKSQFPMELALNNPKKKNPGKLILEHFRMFKKPSFLEYLRGGLELNMIIAIDFTASNGTPTSPSSLHYMDPHKPNQYQVAVESIAQILLNYDSDKRIPAFGFGASLHFPQMELKTASHCFPLSGSLEQLESFGIEHLMQLYVNALKSVGLSGPTYFSPLIQEVASLANNCKNSQQYVYQTLLILTDGEIHDMEKTIDLIVSCSELPLSIIIVGVGDADFTNMVRLDGDNGLYDSKGRKAVRDIVQFVPFRDVKFDPNLLAKELLAQLPGQVVQYFTSMNSLPRQPPPAMKMEELMMQEQSKAQQQVEEMFKKAEFFNEAPSNPYGSS